MAPAGQITPISATTVLTMHPTINYRTRQSPRLDWKQRRLFSLPYLSLTVLFPPSFSYLHGDAPALHGREAVAHVAVAAIVRGLGCVWLRQICPHDGRLCGFQPW